MEYTTTKADAIDQVVFISKANFKKYSGKEPNQVVLNPSDYYSYIEYRPNIIAYSTPTKGFIQGLEIIVSPDIKEGTVSVALNL